MHMFNVFVLNKGLLSIWYCRRVNVANLYSVKDSEIHWTLLAVMVALVVVIKLI